MTTDYEFLLSSPYFPYLCVQKYKSVASVGPCALHTAHSAHPIATPLTGLMKVTDIDLSLVEEQFPWVSQY